MSEQQRPDFKLSYMQQLDVWMEDNVFGPLAVVGSDEDYYVDQVKRAIRQKVLESYHNGQSAGDRKPLRREPRK
jgi:hypothetical protein